MIIRSIVLDMQKLKKLSKIDVRGFEMVIILIKTEY